MFAQIISTNLNKSQMDSDEYKCFGRITVAAWARRTWPLRQFLSVCLVWLSGSQRQMRGVQKEVLLSALQLGFPLWLDAVTVSHQACIPCSASPLFVHFIRVNFFLLHWSLDTANNAALSKGNRIVPSNSPGFRQCGVTPTPAQGPPNTPCGSPTAVIRAPVQHPSHPNQGKSEALSGNVDRPFPYLSSSSQFRLRLFVYMC